MKTLFFLFSIFVIFQTNALACFTAATGEPPCAAWTRADAVFSGRVLKVEAVDKSEEFPAGSRKVRFQVLQNFKGADNPTFAVVARPAEPIKKGETWIVYAANDIVGKSFAEFRRTLLDPKTPSAELETLKQIVAGKTPASIAGQINPTAGERIEIMVEGGGKRYAAETDPRGAFSIDVATEGTYKVEIKIPYRASVKGNEYLLAASNTEGEPTVFRYEVRLNDGDCNYNVFEVTKK